MTEPAAPDTPPPPETSQPKEDLPAADKPESTDNPVQPNDSPEPADDPSKGSDDSPEGSDTAASPPDPAEARETAEPRSRQEHAEPALDIPGRQTQSQASTDEPKLNGDSNGQNENALDLAPGSHHDDSVKPDYEAVAVVRPHTEQERAEHIADVFVRLDKADNEGFSSDELHTIDPKGEIWSSERTVLHQVLLDEIYSGAADVPCDHEAIIAGGLSGAGKTTVLANHPEIDRSKYLTINPDSLKEEMARHGMIPEVEGLSPMEASELVHEESSYLARQLAIRAQADGKNLIWDITMSCGSCSRINTGRAGTERVGVVPGGAHGVARTPRLSKSRRFPGTGCAAWDLVIVPLVGSPPVAAVRHHAIGNIRLVRHQAAAEKP